MVDFLEFDEVFLMSVEFLFLKQIMGKFAFEFDLIFLYQATSTLRNFYWSW